MGALEGRKIIVTGGANGIAAATVRAYAREGAQVVSLDVEDENGEQVAKEASALGGAVTYVHCDISTREVFDVIDHAARTLGGLDVLANVAAIGGRGIPAESIEDGDWVQMLEINVRGTLYTNQAAFRHMKKRGGRIINYGSGAGIRGQPGSAHYAASKAAVLAWTRTVAQEWGRYNITVNAIVPAMWTRLFEDYRQRMTPEVLAAFDERMKATMAIDGRLGVPDRDITPVMVFLASEGPRFVTGQAIAVDGGMIMLES